MSNVLKKGADRLFAPGVLLTFGLIIGLISAIFGWWDWIEPVTGVATLGIAGATWWQTRRAREAVYSDNGDGSWIIALQVGRPVSEAVRKQFGHVDCLLDVKQVIGVDTLCLPEHYEAISRAVYSAICAGQGKNIHLVLSGPVAVSFLIGQLVGVLKFQLTVYQFNPSAGGYEPIPRPTRAWLEHRG